MWVQHDRYSTGQYKCQCIWSLLDKWTYLLTFNLLKHLFINNSTWLSRAAGFSEDIAYMESALVNHWLSSWLGHKKLFR